jgi:hypothetical protein
MKGAPVSDGVHFLNTGSFQALKSAFSGIRQSQAIDTGALPQFFRLTTINEQIEFLGDSVTGWLGWLLC